MSDFRLRCTDGCTILAIIASIFVGVITAFLTLTAAITITAAFTWVTFGIAVVYLAIVYISSTCMRCIAVQNCICPKISVLLTGILGTILTSLILLGITFAATSTVGAVIAGALGFFFSLMITETACLIKCVTGCIEE